MTDPDIPEADRAEGAPHPRHTERLIGHTAAQARLGAALTSGRMHHAWLITGPAGIGKATLAWQVAKVLLAGQSTPVPGALPQPDPQDPALRRLAALSEPGLCLLRRHWDDKRKALSAQITVDSVRGLKRFFALSRPDGGHRVVIVDAAEDMNVNAANALLKQLEEPPAATTFLLISHRPSRLLPTIRSRCRTLALSPLPADETSQALHQALPDLPGDEALRLAELSAGSPGRAVQLHAHDGIALRDTLLQIFATMPGADRNAAHRLGATMAPRGTEDRRSLALELTDELIAEIARHAAFGTADTLPPALRRLAPDPAAGRHWAAAQQEITGRVRQGLAVNLDPQSLFIDMVLNIDRTARSVASQG
ncbi:MAG: DNA polymerase III subunit delta' [Qingshengfaniella sp.]